METEQLVSEGIHHPGNALAQKVRLIDEFNCYWLPIYIMFNQFDRPANLGASLKRIRESALDLYDTRTGEKVNSNYLFLKEVSVETPPMEDYYQLLHYLEGVPKIGTVLPHIYVSDVGSFFMSMENMINSIDEVWKNGYDLSYIKVRLDKELSEFFDEQEVLRSLHESFATKTPPKVPVQVLVPYHRVDNWNRYLRLMGLDIYCVSSDRPRIFESIYYITNVHRLDDLVASVPRKHLIGIIKLTNELIKDLRLVGVKPYKLPLEREDEEEKVIEVPDSSVPEPSLKTFIFADIDIAIRTNILVVSAILLLLVSGIVFPLLYFFGR